MMAAAASIRIVGKVRTDAAAQSAAATSSSPEPVVLSEAMSTVAVLFSVLHYLYSAVFNVNEMVEQEQPQASAPLVASLVTALERSQLLEVACSALLDVPLPPQASIRQLEALTFDIAFATSSLANTISTLAWMSKDPNFIAIGRGPAEDSAGATPAAGQQATLQERVGRLLCLPSTSRLQVVLLKRFCLNAAATAPAGSSNSGGSGCGWEFMDAMRLDFRLCEQVVEEGNRLGGVSSSALLSLALPALCSWSVAAGLPQLHSLLPADLDTQLSGALEATVRLSKARSEDTAPDAAIRVMEAILIPVLDCVGRHRLAVIATGRDRDGRPKAHPKPTELEAVAWAVVASVELVSDQQRLGKASGAGAGGRRTGQRQQRAAGKAGAGLERATQLDLNVNHWLHRLVEATKVQANIFPVEGTSGVSSDAQQDAARRLARAGLLPALDHALRLLATYSDPAVLCDTALAAVSEVTRNLGPQLLLLQHQHPLGEPSSISSSAAVAAAQSGTGASGSASVGGSNSSSSQPASGQQPTPPPSLDLGLYLSVAKLAGTTAAKMEEATALATAAGFCTYSSGEVRRDLHVLRAVLSRTLRTLGSLCKSVGPAVPPPSSPDMAAIAARPGVRAAATFCMRGWLRAALALVRSLEHEHRVLWQPRNVCMFRDARWDDYIGHSRKQMEEVVKECLPDVLAHAPAYLVCLLASDMPLPEVLSLQPEELLCCCGELLAAWLKALDADIEYTLHREARMQMLRQQFPRIAVVEQLSASSDVELAKAAVAGLSLALPTLAAREDTAPLVLKWLRRRGNAERPGSSRSGGAAGRGQEDSSARRGASRQQQQEEDADEEVASGEVPALQMRVTLGEVLRVLQSTRVTGLRSLGACQRCLQDPLSAAAVREPGGERWAALRRCGQRCLRELLLAEQAGAGVAEAGSHLAIREHRCRQALQAAGLEDPQQGAQERPQPAAADMLKACCNPWCGNFEGPSEGALRLCKCAGCKAVRYCGAACQKQHWPYHKSLCPVLKAQRKG
ncbi:hypothetical protein Agub_g3986 [Astrephomene gubernaculifera]|uniref:MYND-type domain-containing protein n=1 Tax=Astrephomene gubernaculifera TaxID=47775 RepID=A0AAD3DM55_9CHLO|nr:hypothetical protein Agub_g3986 [Astrephomene gubernaculifera]